MPSLLLLIPGVIRMAVVESAVKDALASVDVGGIDPMGAP